MALEATSIDAIARNLLLMRCPTTWAALLSNREQLVDCDTDVPRDLAKKRG
jgi:hypothetical protein